VNGDASVFCTFNIEPNVFAPLKEQVQASLQSSGLSSATMTSSSGIAPAVDASAPAAYVLKSQELAAALMSSLVSGGLGALNVVGWETNER
jgi:hypothetical protein